MARETVEQVALVAGAAKILGVENELIKNRRNLLEKSEFWWNEPCSWDPPSTIFDQVVRALRQRCRFYPNVFQVEVSSNAEACCCIPAGQLRSENGRSLHVFTFWSFCFPKVAHRSATKSAAIFSTLVEDILMLDELQAIESCRPGRIHILHTFTSFTSFTSRGSSQPYFSGRHGHFLEADAPRERTLKQFHMADAFQGHVNEEMLQKAFGESISCEGAMKDATRIVVCGTLDQGLKKTSMICENGRDSMILPHGRKDYVLCCELRKADLQTIRWKVWEDKSFWNF